MKNIFKRLWIRRWFRVCAWLAISLFTVLVLLRQYVGWSGARRWTAVQATLAREGESLDFHTVAPDPVPDEQNFCAIPPLKDLPLILDNVDVRSQEGLKRMRLLDAALPHGKDSAPMPKRPRGASFGEAADMSAWAAWLRREGPQPPPPASGNLARDVLTALSRNDPLVGELALGLSRPDSQWTPAWKKRVLPEPLFSIRFPHYQVAMGLTSMLCMRSVAGARAGDAPKAHQSLLVAVRINEANTKEPLLIGALVAMANTTVISNGVWELCDAHAGTAEEFHTLQDALFRLDYRECLLRADRGELVLGADIFAFMKRDRSGMGILMGAFEPQPKNPSILISSALRLIPDGFFDGQTAALAQMHFDYIIKPLRDAGFKQQLARQQELESLMVERHRYPYGHLDEVLADLISAGRFERVPYRRLRAKPRERGHRRVRP